MNLAMIDDRVCEAKPFIKWAGGKGQLISTYQRYYPHVLTTGRIKRYIEPFVGGGALLFNILQTYSVKEAIIIDINIDLINAYKSVRDNVKPLIELLKDLENEYILQDIETRKETYYSIRKTFNSQVGNPELIDIEKAAQFIFLNKTCFNGLYRVNKSGHFNVPSGDYKNPKICDTENLIAVSTLLERVEIICGDFQEASTHLDSSSFIYFDPPYRPLNTTSSFTSYTKQDFNDNDQIELARFYRKLHNNGALLMLSNSDPHNVNLNDNFFDSLYEGFNIHRVNAKRAINSKGGNRGEVSEVLITNYLS